MSTCEYPRANFQYRVSHTFTYSVDDSSTIKKAVLALGYVDFNHIKQKAKQADEGEVADGNGNKIDL